MVPQSFRSRLAAMFAGELVNKGCVALAFMLLARTLPPATYGEIEWALSIVTVGLLVTDAGLATWSVAQVAALPIGAMRTFVAQVGWLRLSLAAPTCVVLLAIAWSHGGSAGAALALYSLVPLFSPFFLQYLFDGLLQTRWTALGNALRGATFLAAVALLVDAGSPPSRVAAAEVSAAAVLAVYAVLVARHAIRLDVSVREGRGGLGSLLSRSWRVGASDVVWGIHSYVGLIVLGYLARPTDAAWHSASLRLLLAAHTAVFLYLSTLLPNLARLLKGNVAGWRRLVEESLGITTWVGCGMALVGTLGAGPILTTVFGGPFAASAPGFRAMIWVVPISWISGHLRFSLIAANHPHREFQARLAATATTVVLTLALAGPLGSTGTGVALVAGSAANLLAAWWLARGVLPECGYWRSVSLAIGATGACLALGLIMTSATGPVVATLVAGSAMATLGLVTERDRARDLLGAIVGGGKDGARADA